MRTIVLIVLGSFLCLSAFCQDRAELEKRRQSIIESIKQTQAELESTRQNKNATMSQLRALQAKLSERQRLISNINAEIGAINTNIQMSSREVAQLRNNLENLKIRYAQSLRYAYANRSSYDMLAFLFSSNDFNDAVRRVKYLKKYRDYRKEQVAQIHVTQGQIQSKIGELNSVRAQKDILLMAQEQQKKVLVTETSETNEIVKELKGKEKNLAAQIEKNRKATRQLDKTINDMIRREIELARKKAEEEARKKEEEEKRRLAAANASNGSIKVGTKGTYDPNAGTNTAANKPATNPKTEETNEKPVASNVRPPKAETPKPNYNLSLTPEAAALSNSFEANKGRLPWPVEKGFISDRFGTHPHPLERKVMIDNNGIDIRTAAGATARAVFDGNVTNVFYLAGRGWNVLISHGNFFTIYSFLASASVKKGDKVHTKQPIGIVGTNDEGDNVINFQVWRGASKTDPEGWIAR